MLKVKSRSFRFIVKAEYKTNTSENKLVIGEGLVDDIEGMLDLIENGIDWDLLHKVTIVHESNL